MQLYKYNHSKLFQNWNIDYQTYTIGSQMDSRFSKILHLLSHHWLIDLEVLKFGIEFNFQFWNIFIYEVLRIFTEDEFWGKKISRFSY